MDYFRGRENSEILDSFIDENILCTNYLIHSELVPALTRRKRSKLVSLLMEVNRIPLNINWEYIIRLQTACLSNGINKVGIPDLIILDNVIQNDLVLYSFDTHFDLIRKYMEFKLFLP